MRDASLQQDLFGELEKRGQKRVQKNTILPKSYALVNVSYEQIIFISIAIIMLMVLLFSLGVEYGKHIARSGEVSVPLLKPEKHVKEAVVPQPVKEEIKQPQPAPPQAVKGAEPALQEELRKIPSPPKGGGQKFTIQAVAYRSKKMAQDDMVALSKRGFSPFIVVGDGYYQVCTGEYTAKEEAMRDYEKLKKLYKDCFIRKR